MLEPAVRDILREAHAERAAILRNQSAINRAMAQPKHTAGRWPVANDNYLTVQEAHSIEARAFCGNCHGDHDLTYHVQLQWLLCGECRKLYVKALRELTPEGRIARSYRPIGGYMREETDDQ